MEPESTAGGRLGCPKRMVFGPCGGVRDDERCELAEHRCVFVGAPLVPLARRAVARARAAARRPAGAAPPRGPVVLTDLSVPPFDPASVRRVVGVLAPVSDGLLVGEHANRPDFPPTMFAAEVLDAGGRLWTTLACRDRNRVVLEQELAGLAALGVDGVLCVTGDGRGVERPARRRARCSTSTASGWPRWPRRPGCRSPSPSRRRRRRWTCGRPGWPRSSGPARSSACSTT